MACSFIWTSAPFERVESVGHWIDTEGVHAFQEGAGHPAGMNPKKCSGIMLGARYYDRFIPNLVAVLYPLHELLCTNKPWSWSRKCQKAFEEANDASPCIWCQSCGFPHQPDGKEHPVAYVSPTSTASEQNYPPSDS